MGFRDDCRGWQPDSRELAEEDVDMLWPDRRGRRDEYAFMAPRGRRVYAGGVEGVLARSSTGCMDSGLWGVF